MRVFHIDAYVPPKPYFDTTTPEDSSRQLRLFMDLLDKLEALPALKTEHREQIDSLFADLTDVESKWFARVLNKDLKCGVGAKTYLSVHKGAFPLFEVQLCDPIDLETDDCSWLLTGDYDFQPKLDGLRTIAIPSRPDGKTLVWNFFSRNGKALYGLDKVAKQLQLLCPSGNLVFDGEGKGKDFDTSMSQLRTESNTETDAIYHVFDCLPLEHWEAKTKKLDLKARRDILSKVFANTGPGVIPNIQMVQSINCVPPITTKEQLVALLETYSRTCEGLVIKDLASYYEWKRRWLKLKKMKSLDLPIVGLQPGTGKYEGMLGAFVVEHEGVRSEVGTGLDDALRASADEKLIGRIIEVCFQEITKDGQLRFPSLKCFRPDKEE